MMAGEVSIADGCKQADAELADSFARLKQRWAAESSRPAPVPCTQVGTGVALISLRDGERIFVATTIAKRQVSDLARAQARTGYLFVLPTSLLYLTFVLAPVVLTFILSFSYYDPMLGSRWVGFDNFTRFFTNRRSLQIFWNTLRFALFAVTFNVSIGLLLAMALNRAMPGWLLYFFRLAFFLPVIIAAAFVSIVWGYFFADDLGVINYFLRLAGLPERALADRQPQRHDARSSSWTSGRTPASSWSSSSPPCRACRRASSRRR